MTIKDIIEKINSETTIDDIMPDLAEIGTYEDGLMARVTELEADVSARDEEIRDLKNSNFELMKKIFDKPPVKKNVEIKEEIITDDEIFEEMR